MSPLAFAERVDEASHEAFFIEMEDTTKLEVLDWGGDNKPTLFLLAGMPMNAHTYDEFAAHFTDDFRVVALTRIGHGNSEPPENGDFSIERLATDGSFDFNKSSPGANRRATVRRGRAWASLF